LKIGWDGVILGEMSTSLRHSGEKLLIVQKPEFLSRAVTTRYLEFGRSANVWEKHKTDSYWSTRIIHYGDMPPEMGPSIIEIMKSVKATIKAEFKPAYEIYPDDFIVVRWMKGDDHELHADSENPGGQPHPFPWREFTSIIYLNDDFEGGDLCFPNQNVVVTPTPRMLVFFSGKLEYIHEVKQITAGTRYTLSSFWTFDGAQCIYPEIFRPD
jgi:hypothetical protein